MKNYYNILGIAETATSKEILEAYKKLAQKFHPDKNGNDAFFASCFREINEARQVLIDDAKRADYDNQLHNFLDAYELLKLQQNEDHYQRLERKNKYVKKKSETGKWLLAAFVMVLVIGVFLFYIEDDNKMDSTNYKTLSESIKEGEEFKIITPEGEIDKEDRDKDADLVPRQVKNIVNTHAVIIPNTSKSIKKKIAKNAEEPSLSAKPLTDTQLRAILHDLQNNNESNCVQIIQQQGSMLDKDFSVANFLQQNGYVIAGRELSKVKLKGITVEKTEGCSKLYIGID